MKKDLSDKKFLQKNNADDFSIKLSSVPLDEYYLRNFYASAKTPPAVLSGSFNQLNLPKYLSDLDSSYDNSTYSDKTPKVPSPNVSSPELFDFLGEEKEEKKKRGRG